MLPITTSLTAILPVIRQKLIDDEILQGTRINFTVEEDWPHLSAQQDILLKVRTEKRHGNFQMGSGRYDVRVKRTLQVILRTRKLSDKVGSDYKLLNDTAVGVIAIEDSIIESLEDFIPVDANGNMLTFEGLEFSDISEPQKAKAQKDWTSSSVNFTIPYRRAVTTTLYAEGG